MTFIAQASFDLTVKERTNCERNRKNAKIIFTRIANPGCVVQLEVSSDFGPLTFAVSQAINSTGRVFSTQYYITRMVSHATASSYTLERTSILSYWIPKLCDILCFSLIAIAKSPKHSYLTLRISLASSTMLRYE